MSVLGLGRYERTLEPWCWLIVLMKLGVATSLPMAAEGASKAAIARAADLPRPTVYTILAEER